MHSHQGSGNSSFPNPSVSACARELPAHFFEGLSNPFGVAVGRLSDFLAVHPRFAVRSAVSTHRTNIQCDTQNPGHLADWLYAKVLGHGREFVGHKPSSLWFAIRGQVLDNSSIVISGRAPSRIGKPVVPMPRLT